MTRLVYYAKSIFLITLLHNLKTALSETGGKQIQFSSKGIECTTPCATKGEKYFWCTHVNNGWDYCSTSPHLDYKGNQCENKCGKHGKGYEWCWTKNGNWGYCSKKGHSRVHIKQYGSKTGKKCSSTCTKHGGTWYYWCRTEESNWDYCSPSSGTNYAGTECKDACSKKGNTAYYWCNDHKAKWQYCSPIETTLQGKCSASPLTNLKKSLSKGRNGISTRFSRAVNTNMDEFEENENLCRNMAANYLQLIPDLQEHVIPGDGQHNPIMQVWHTGEGATRLPYIVHSSIFRHHLNCPRSNFGAPFDAQMTFMDRRVGVDVKGHIVASRLCGPAEWYNLAPQTNQLNIGRDYESWYSTEALFSQILHDHECLFLDHWVFLIYEGGSRRPEHFQLCYTFNNVNTDEVRIGPTAQLYRNV